MIHTDIRTSLYSTKIIERICGAHFTMHLYWLLHFSAKLAN